MGSASGLLPDVVQLYQVAANRKRPLSRQGSAIGGRRCVILTSLVSGTLLIVFQAILVMFV